MKLKAEICDERYEVQVKRDGDKVIASVGSREYELEVSVPEPGVFLFKNGGKVVEAFVSPPAKSGEPYQVQIGGHSLDVNLIDPKRLRGSVGSGEHGDGTAEVRTAMPGKVVRILLGPGAEVSKGDGVLVVEAMKMQNELKAPKAGAVKEIRVREGATVSAGEVLATIE